MKTMRQRSFAVAIAAACTLGLTACQDSAPPVAQNTSSSTSSTSPSSTESSSSTSSETSSSSSTESSSSSTESSTTASSGGSQASQAGMCNNTSSFFVVKGSGTKVAKYGEANNVEGSGDAKVDLTVSKGTVQDGGGDYPYDADTQALVFDVKFKRTSSDGYLIATPLAFSLVDESGRNCQRDSSPDFILGKDLVNVESINNEKTEYSGKIAFVVPKGKDYSKYTLLWNEDYKGGTEAGFGWQG